VSGDAGRCPRSRRSTPPTACRTVIAGRPGTSPYRPSVAQDPTRGWLVTEHAAVDTELGILKNGKEADVFLIRRGIPGTDRSFLLAAKRYRSADHRMFHRDVGYLEGRRTRDTRENRAVASRSTFGRQAIAGQWANAEFTALAWMHAAGVPVP
jgi:RIO kinase 1